MSRTTVVRSLMPLMVAVSACGLSERPDLPTNVVGHCRYTNKFAGGLECRDYLGSWTATEAEADCKGQKDPAFELATACNESEILAWCLVPDEGKDMKVAFIGTDAGECGTKQTGCEVFAGGFFEPAPPCGGDRPDDGGSSTPVWQQPKLICKAPKEGEPAGKGPDGQVCTWQMISGATEEGRRFSDYADCSAVLTQRPYWPAPEDERVNTPDSRLEDPTYKTEVEWVRSQLTAGACVCCHGREAPQGASNWTVDSPNFINGFHDRGVAMGAGWIRSVGFGAYPPEQNNGFVRPTLESPDGSIFPTTDPQRMIRFWLGEAAHRGIKEEQFAADKYRASPLDDQMAYKPTDCSESEGIGADGKIRWKFGAARYLWVLSADASSPGVPPNLDLPSGTIWNVYVSSDGGTPIPNGTASYGTLPAGALQKFPADGAAPAALESGRKYYLYALSDIGLPVTRCLFKAP